MLNRAKAALQFAGHYRVCDFVLSNLMNSGIIQAGILIQYLPASLLSHIGSGKWWDFDGGNRILKMMPPFMGVHQTEWFKGTADGIARNLDFILDSPAEHILILSCEHLYKMDYREVLAYHLEKNAAMTLVVNRQPQALCSTRLGYCTVNPANGRLTQLIEKPQTPPHDVISTGITFFRRDVLLSALRQYEKNPVTHNFTRDVMIPLIEKEVCYGFEFKGYWNYLEDIGQYYDVHMDMTRGASPVDPGAWDVMTNLDARLLGSAPPTYYAPTARVADSLISPGGRIAGAVSRSIISPGVCIEEGAVVEDSILMSHCTVGAGARLKRVIADKDVIFAPECQVGWEGEALPGVNPELPRDHRQIVVIGKAARIAPGMRIAPAAQVYPGTDTEAMGIRSIASGQNINSEDSRWSATDSGFLPRKRA